MRHSAEAFRQRWPQARTRRANNYGGRRRRPERLPWSAGCSLVESSHSPPSVSKGQSLATGPFCLYCTGQHCSSRRSLALRIALVRVKRRSVRKTSFAKRSTAKLPLQCSPVPLHREQLQSGRLLRQAQSRRGPRPSTRDPRLLDP